MNADQHLKLFFACISVIHLGLTKEKRTLVESRFELMFHSNAYPLYVRLLKSTSIACLFLRGKGTIYVCCRQDFYKVDCCGSQDKLMILLSTTLQLIGKQYKFV